MKKLTCVFTILIIITWGICVDGKRFEGEIIEVNLANSSLIIDQKGEKYQFYVREDARLYFNNSDADLGMFSPITPSDFLSGYLITDDNGMVKEAYFYYLVREGVVESIDSISLVLKETESGVCDEYKLSSQYNIYLNNYPARLENIEPGMKALVTLDHNYHVKKISLYHYDYTGIVEAIDLEKKVIVLNVGSRLNPEFKEFCITENVCGMEEKWENIMQRLKDNNIILAKIIINSTSKMITFLDIRSM